MILDRLLQFSSAQDVSQAAGTYASTDVIDFGVGTSTSPAIPSNAQGGGVRDMGIGDNPALKFVVQMIEGLDSAGGTATLSVTIQGAPDDGTGSPGSYVSWWASPAYTEAQAVAGARLLDMDFPRPPQGKPVPRFVRLLYTIAGETSTLGTVSAWLVLDRDDQMYNGSDNSIIGGYRAGINVAN